LKITFPHMGRVYIPLKTVFEELGAEVIIPPTNNSYIKELGCKYSPEYACMPFKLILGDILYSLEKGADTVIMLGGSGPCRFGYFGHMLNLISKDLGFKFDYINLEPPNIMSSLTHFKKLPSFNYKRILTSLLLGWKKLQALDMLEKKYWNVLPYSSCREKVKQLMNESIKNIEKCRTFDETVQVYTKYYELLANLKNNGIPLPRICILGDIYTLNEPYSNYNIETFLSNKGVEVVRTIYTSTWITNNIIPWKKKEKYSRMLNKVRGYLNNGVGGFGLDTVYHTLKYADMGFDGILHIMPITCMPEIVSREIIEKIAREKNINIIPITVDEHNDTIGLQTRLEAFAEILHQKKYRAD